MQNSIREQLSNYQAPRWDDFTLLPLYMDQVLLQLQTYLDPLYFENDKSALTSSMINNYVKHSILKPPVKKKYKNYHLAYLYVVMVLKKVFSLDEIAALIDIYAEIDTPDNTSRNFNRFADVFEASLHQVIETGNAHVEYFENPTWQQQLMCTAIEACAARIGTQMTVCSLAEQSEDEAAG